MQGSYYDPRALLAEDAVVPCTFNFAVAKLGQALEPSCASDYLPSHSRVDLPVWLATSLTNRNITNLRTPKVYNERAQRKAAAGAACINLKPAPYFYDVGMQYNTIMKSGELASFLRQTFQERYKELLSSSLMVPDGPQLQETLVKLNDEEKRLFEAGREGAFQQETWWNNKGRGAMTNHHQKRLVSKRKRPTDAAADKENRTL
eukprot:jgi/Chrzof1/6737/Cz19g07080.t1